MDWENIHLTATDNAFAYKLQLDATGPLVLQGDQGYSIKSAQGQASYYYSQPHYEITGTLTLSDTPVAVTGHGWLDREWSSQPLAEDQTGWDWFSLRFDSGEKLMGFVLRGGSGDYTSGTWIAADGSTKPLSPGQFQATMLETSHVQNRKIPTAWSVKLPEKDVTVEVRALNPDSWMGTSFPYWEGPVRISGSHSGTGYLEMTGYE